MQEPICDIIYSIAFKTTSLWSFPIFTAKSFYYLWDLFTVFKRAYSLLWHTLLKNQSIFGYSFSVVMACFFEPFIASRQVLAVIIVLKKL